MKNRPMDDKDMFWKFLNDKNILMSDLLINKTT